MGNVVSVVPFEGKFMEDVNSLWGEEYTDDHLAKRRRLFDWVTTGNPFSAGSIPYFLLIHQGKVIGMHGHMPVKFRVNGRETTGYWAHDDLLAKDYRGRGLGKELLQGATGQADLFAGVLWLNESSYRLYLNNGWLDVPEFYPYVKIFDPAPFIRRKLKSEIGRKLISMGGKCYLKIRDKFREYSLPEGINIFRIERFDEKFDRLFETVSAYFKLITVRNKEYLNWKFVEKPHNNYKIFAGADKANELSGYVVIKRDMDEERVRGRILDVLAHPGKPEVFSGLIYRSLEEFIGIKASFVEIFCTYPPFVELLKQMGFVKRQRPERFMVRNWEKNFNKEFIGDIKNWYLTLSDADGDSWEVDSTDAW